MKVKLKYQVRNAVSKWLYMAVLLVTLWSISGFVNPARTQLFAQQATKAINKPKPVDKCMSYKRAITQVKTRALSEWLLLLFDIDLNALHTRQCKTKNCCACLPANKQIMFDGKV